MAEVSHSEPARRQPGPANPVFPAMTMPEERIAEISEILAAGLMRLRARKSSKLSADPGETCVDFSPDPRGHAPLHGCAENDP